MTTRQKIKQIRGPMTKTIPADEIGEGETITVRRPTAGERRELMRKFFDGSSVKDGMGPDMQLWIVKKFCIADDGAPLFDDKESLECDLDALLVDRINDAFLELNKRDNVSPETLEKN